MNKQSIVSLKVVMSTIMPSVNDKLKNVEVCKSEVLKGKAYSCLCDYEIGEHRLKGRLKASVKTKGLADAIDWTVIENKTGKVLYNFDTAVSNDYNLFNRDTIARRIENCGIKFIVTYLENKAIKIIEHTDARNNVNSLV